MGTNILSSNELTLTCQPSPSLLVAKSAVSLACMYCNKQLQVAPTFFPPAIFTQAQECNKIVNRSMPLRNNEHANSNYLCNIN
ncbi:hypothetical protein FKM82_019596 [Ascaphus truei]